jgi:hypothetical protein
LATGSALTFDGANLGVGTASPSTKFHVVGTGALARVTNTSSTGYATWQTYNDTGLNTSFGTGGSTASLFANCGFIDVGANYPLVFAINDTEAMRLTSSSLYTASGINVGIGLSNPSQLLSLYKASGGVKIHLDRATNTQENSIVLNLAGANQWQVGTGVSGAGSDFEFYDYSGTAGTRVVIKQGGNVGIGTSSPAAKLDVVGIAKFSGGSGYVSLGDNGYLRTDVSGWFAIQQGSNGFQIRDSANGSARLIFDSNYNLGLGVTPSAWSTFKAIQVAGAGSIHSSGNGNMRMGSNFYFDGTNYVRTGADYANMYSQNDSSGYHAWFNAASSTAGSTISWTQAMTLDASGNLGVGTTSPSARLHVGGNAVIAQPSAANSYLSVSGSSGSYSGIISLQRGGTEDGAIYCASSNYNPASATAADIVFSNSGGGRNFRWVNNTTLAMTLDSSGNLLVGTTSSLGGLGARVDIDSATGRGIAQNITSTSPGRFQEYLYSGSTVGSISTNGTITIYNTTSDYRLKNNQQPLTGSGAFIDALQPKTWNWAQNGSKGAGFIAHEFAEVSPSSVNGEKDALDAEGNPVYQSMQASSAEVIANLVAEIQSLRQRLSAANL